MAYSKRRKEELIKLFLVIPICIVATAITAISIYQEEESKPDQEQVDPEVKTFDECDCLESNNPFKP